MRGVDGVRRASTVASDDRGHTLTHHGVGTWVSRQGEIAVGVEVDEPRRHGETGHVDHRPDAGVEILPHVHNQAVAYRHVRVARGRAGAVDDGPPPEEDRPAPLRYPRRGQLLTSVTETAAAFEAVMRMPHSMWRWNWTIMIGWIPRACSPA